jgi:hypothetical protein
MNSGKPQRAWERIAEEASKERDPQKLLKLVGDLIQAIDEQFIAMHRGQRKVAISR